MIKKPIDRLMDWISTGGPPYGEMYDDIIAVNQTLKAYDEAEVFTIGGDELKTLNEWMRKKNLNKYGGAIGGRFTYSFTPTSIGVAKTVTDCQEQKDTIDLTDYEGW